MNWTKRKRFNLEPTKSHALVLHKEKRVRNNIKAYPVWLDKNNRVQINWVSDATLLGVTLLEMEGFGTHYQEGIKK